MARRKPDVLPIRIRANLVVTITGLPHDLTPAEAAKIADVVMALGGSPMQSLRTTPEGDRWAERLVPSLADVVNRPGQLDVDEDGDWRQVAE